MTTHLLHGDCREILKTLPDDSVHCCVTSPPYWGLRSYLPADHPDKPKEIGSEPTLQEWVDTMVQVFREVRRVLRPDGTLWLNLGDAYAGGGRGGGAVDAKQKTNVGSLLPPIRLTDGLKAKDLMGQPWRVAFALQADGWWLRQEVIWAKRNPMPESTRDRFTKAHEHVFLLSKQERYFFNFDAVQEPVEGGAHARIPGNKSHKGTEAYEAGDEKHRTKAGLVGYAERMRAAQGVGHRQGPPGNPAPTPKAALASSGNDGAYSDGKSSRMGRGAGWRTKNNASFDEAMAVMPDTRNPRSVRWLASEPFSGAHFATYPSELIRPFILAGCPEGGTVLDPFGGSGTTGMEADRQHKHAILIDLDERNIPMARERITGDSPLFAEVSA